MPAPHDPGRVPRQAGPAPLADRLAQGGATKDRLQSHPKTCQWRLLAAGQPAVTPSVPLQDRVADSAAGPADQRGFLRRIRAWIGL